MSQIKLYIYPNAKPHVQDAIADYNNTVPFSQQGLLDYVDFVEPHEAEYFYMGQFADNSNGPEFLNINKFPYFLSYPDRHIADIEGDWSNAILPVWMAPVIKTINGADFYLKGQKLFVRPAMSKLLVHLAKDPPEFADTDIKYTFQGLIQPCMLSLGVNPESLLEQNINIPTHNLFNSLQHPRHKMLAALKLSQVPVNLNIRHNWNALTDVNNEVVTSYTANMNSGLLALCPAGNGKDSVRFFEACAYGRIPVVIGHNILMGEEEGLTDFVLRIEPWLTAEEMADRLVNIISLPKVDLIDRACAAHEYFNSVVVPYFQDPTLRFLEWLSKVQEPVCQ